MKQLHNHTQDFFYNDIEEEYWIDPNIFYCIDPTHWNGIDQWFDEGGYSV